jgi:hypothetical protein
MGCSTRTFRVATGEGSDTNTIALPLRNINVLAFPKRDFGKLHRCPYLSDLSIEYPSGDHRGQAGWDIAIPYENLEDLANNLDVGVRLDDETEARFGPRWAQPIRPGEISRLAFMTHGDQGGEWYANGEHSFPLMAKPHAEGESVEVAASVLRRIGRYTKPFGSNIILLGCLAGQGKGGTELLMALSAIWPRCTIAGFDVIGYRHAGTMTKGRAGDGEYAGMKLTWCKSQLEFQGGGRTKVDAKWDQLEWASEFSKDHAKLVMDQRLLRCPPDELCPENGRYPSAGASSKAQAAAAPAHQATPAQYSPARARPPAKPTGR